MPRDVIEQGIAALGQRADMSLSDQTREARALVVSQYVRRLHGASVGALHDLERFMLVELDAAPEGVQDVLIKDAISVIRARNHIGQVAKALGMSWADGMRLQSTLCDLVRHAGANGGGLLQTTVKEDRAEIVLKVRLGADPIDLTLLSGLESLTSSMRTKKTSGEFVVEVLIERSHQQGAA